MDIIGPTPVQLYNVHPTTPTQGVQDAVQHNLLLHQMIQATVMESAGRQVLLEFGQQQFKAQTDVEMQSGQKLNLEVVATEPRLKLQVVSPTTDNQLLRLIHLYDHRTEIGSSLKNLLGQRFSVSGSGQAQAPVQGTEVSTPSAFSSQEGQISAPSTLLSSQNPTLGAASSRAQVGSSLPLPSQPSFAQEAQPSVLQERPIAANTSKTMPLAPQASNPQTTSSQSPQNSSGPGPFQPGISTNSLPSSPPPGQVASGQQSQTPITQTGPVVTNASNGMAPTPQSGNAQATTPSPSTTLSATPQTPMGANSTSLGPSQPAALQSGAASVSEPPVGSKSLAFTETEAVTQNRKAREEIPLSLAPPSPQQVAGMTTLLHRLDGSSTVANALFTAINLVPLSAQQKKTVEGALTPEQWSKLEGLAQELGTDLKAVGARILFNLSHHLGLDYEVLLSQQKSDQAAETLKGALMTLSQNEDVPEGVRDNSRQLIQQLELLQLTRARFAQEGILFLPLPFEFMEQGYALVEQRSGGRDGEAASHVVTLNMSLEGLGAVQANLLFESQALFVRILCQDEESQAALEEDLSDLEQALAPFSVRSIQVALGAEDPAVELINRLQPHHDNVFDARV